MNITLIILDALAVILQLAAAYFGYKIYQYNRSTKWWLALVLAFVIQAVRRAITLSSDWSITTASSSVILDRSLAAIISLLIMIGLWAMLKNFENFSVIENKIEKKLKK
jgi:dolichyl-phosphate-mannose--protein O-mannosyl transferase